MEIKSKNINFLSDNIEDKSFWGYYVKNFEIIWNIFKGRAGRKEHISCLIFTILLTILYYGVLFIVESLFSNFLTFLITFSFIFDFVIEIVSTVYFIVYIRRLHDLGISARIYFLILVLSIMISLVFYIYSAEISKTLISISLLVFTLFNIIFIFFVKGKSYPNIYGMPVK